MNDNEFKKLDQFMREHAPPLKEGPLPKPKFKIGVGLQLAFALVLILAVGIFTSLPVSLVEEASAMEEILLWEVTSDEFPVEYETTLEVLE